MPAPERRRPFCRARAVVLDGGRVLIARHIHPDGRDFWCFPGGGVEPGEGFAEAARRELREEAGLEVELAGLLHAQDFPSGDAFELIFLGRRARGSTAEIALGRDPERSPDQAPVLRELAWVSPADLPGYGVLPAGLARRLARGSVEVVPLPEDEGAS